MSHFEEIPEQSEGVVMRPIAWTLAITVLTIIACGVVVWTLDAFHLRGGGRSNIVELDLVPPAQPFSSPTQVELHRAVERTDLDRWSWVDRRTGHVRMPVGAAIDRYLQLRGAR